MKKLAFVSTFTSILFVPLVSYAQSLTPIRAFIVNVQGIVNLVIPLMVTLALVFFFWGLISYIRSAGNAKKAREGRGIMIWGIVALFVMVSIWGIIGIMQRTFDINGTETVTVPAINRLPPARL